MFWGDTRTQSLSREALRLSRGWILCVTKGSLQRLRDLGETRRGAPAFLGNMWPGPGWPGLPVRGGGGSSPALGVWLQGP